MGCVSAHTASTDRPGQRRSDRVEVAARAEMIKIHNLDWQLCPKRAIISFDAIVAPN